MNYMKEVTQMLGVELEEEFKLKRFGEARFKLTQLGFYCFDEESYSWKYSFSLTDILIGNYEITKIPKPILDEVEKEYLSNIIKPFRNKVICIYKQTSVDCEDERIEIAFNDHSIDMYFPYFKKGTMYKGMKLLKEYSLEDLGL